MNKKNLQALFALASACLLSHGATGFTARGPLSKVGKRSKSDVLVLLLTPKEQEQAAAMSEYLVRAHEDKLKAVQDMERKKQAEIDTLKQQMAELEGNVAKQQSPSSSMVPMAPPNNGDNLETLTKEQLINRVISYQQFMGKYVVDAQQQKAKAVREAEAAVAKKYDEKLQLALSGAASPAASAALPAKAKTPVSRENQLYMERNARVSAAADAGKSRWGEMESQRAKAAASGASVAISSTSSPTAAVVDDGATNVVNVGAQIVNGATLSPPPPEVIAADHGLRADGGVSGLTLAERVAQGAGAASVSVQPAASATLSKNEILFQQRNAMVVAAGKAGKSRWGSMEIQKAEEFASKQLVGSASTAQSAVSVQPAASATLSKNEILFQQRNAMVVAAGKAGKSRWGSMEIQKAEEFASKQLAGSAPAAVAATDVTEADHGLRSSGAVGGPTLSERVNLGAQIIGKS